MPNGYTAAIYEGSDDAFAYLNRVARDFGAYIELRDTPITDELPEIPETLPEDAYERRRLAETEAELVRWRSMSPEQAATEYAVECERIARDNEARRLRAERMAQRYDKVRAVVERFVPPTPDHVNYKETALKYLDESRRFDVSDYTESIEPDPLAWRTAKLTAAVRSVERARLALAEAENRQASRYEWVRQLREALADLRSARR